MDARQYSTTPIQHLPQEMEKAAQETAPWPLEEARQHTERHRTLGRLASTLSHEIANPFNAIFLHTDLLEEDLMQLPAPARVPMLSSLADIKTEVARLYAIVQDYLTLARLGELTYEPEVLESVVEVCSMEMHEFLAARGLTLHLDGLASLGLVALHRTTMQRALSHLLRQIASSMPAGGILSISGRQEGQRACLEICGAGAGIPAAELSSVFEPWHVSPAEGTGLELSVAYAVVVAHGGNLTVQSPDGQGTTFTMRLPCVEGTCDRSGVA